MKIIPYFILFLLFFPTSCKSAKNGEKFLTPEDLSEYLTEAILKNDYEQFTVGTMNLEDLEYTIKNNFYGDKELTATINENKMLRLDFFQKENKTSFERVRTEAQGYTFKNVAYEITEDENGVNFIRNLKMNLTKADKHISIIFESLLKVQRGWVNIGKFKIENNNDFEQACRICLIEEGVLDYKKEITNAFATKMPQKLIDSLKKGREDLENKYDAEIASFQENRRLKSTFFAKDSARSWCMNSFSFGADLEASKRDSLLSYLYGELVNCNSGFTINGRKSIENRQPMYNDQGQIYIWSKTTRHEEEIIDDWDEWKANELVAFDNWANDIDKYIIKLHNKPYSDFDEIEKVAFDFHLSSLQKN